MPPSHPDRCRTSTPSTVPVPWRVQDGHPLTANRLHSCTTRSPPRPQEPMAADSDTNATRLRPARLAE